MFFFIFELINRKELNVLNLIHFYKKKTTKTSGVKGLIYLLFLLHIKGEIFGDEFDILII